VAVAGNEGHLVARPLPAVPPEPQPTGPVERVLKRHGEAATGCLTPEARHAVGHHDQSSAFRLACRSRESHYLTRRNSPFLLDRTRTRLVKRMTRWFVACRAPSDTGVRSRCPAPCGVNSVQCRKPCPYRV